MFKVSMLISFGFALTLVGHSQEWRISTYKLQKTVSENTLLRVELSAAKGKTKTVDVVSPLTHESSISSFAGKIVVLGAAGNAGIVVLHSIKEAKTSWFYCYQPTLLSRRWVAAVEWYPNHSTAIQTDVVLLFDLAHPQYPFPGDKYSFRVGTPVYPERNAREKTYDNTVSDGQQANLVLGPPLVALSGNRLAFIAVTHAETGIENARIVLLHYASTMGQPLMEAVRLPTDPIPNSNIPFSYLRINSITEVPNGSFELGINKSEFGVPQIVIPKAPSVQ